MAPSTLPSEKTHRGVGGAFVVHAEVLTTRNNQAARVPVDDDGIGAAERQAPAAGVAPKPAGVGVGVGYRGGSARPLRGLRPKGLRCVSS